jgi:two-component system, LytTR family, sensor histidine kinase AlgZ
MIGGLFRFRGPGMAYSSALGRVSLPDFRNLGVLSRALVLAEGVSWVAFAAQSPSLGEALGRFSSWAPGYELAVLLVLLVLAGASRWLARLPHPVGVLLVLGVSAGVALAVGWGIRALLVLSSPVDPLKTGIVAVAVAGVILVYFDWRQSRLSPALGEARLAALRARIRPHFLFNSLNTVVSVVRKDPALAERILLDLSDLFREVLAERRGVVPLQQELDLAKAYGQIEALRLGDRLRLRWEVEEAALPAQVPILVLQPLLENAVRYGVEPVAKGGDVVVRVAKLGRFLMVEVKNSLGPEAAPPGHGMALANIRERLALHFDAEARLRSGAEDGVFVVRLEMPWTFSRLPGGARSTDRPTP